LIGFSFDAEAGYIVCYTRLGTRATARFERVNDHLLD
jgi:hypothetical protein